ncbi:MAG: hypothetical protein ACI90Y_000186 [Polaromonas sp.]|jgi:hypothetical protein
MSGDLPFACACGKVTGTLAGQALKTGTRLTCGCASCRAAVKHLTGQTVGNVDVYLTSGHLISYETGFELLASLNLSPKGSNRIYATCCNSAISVVPQSPRIGFSSVFVNRLATPEVVGPIKAQVYRTEADGKRHIGMAKVVREVGKRVVSDRVSGNWRKSPYFKGAGALVVAKVLIEKDAKTAAFEA